MATATYRKRRRGAAVRRHRRRRAAVILIAISIVLVCAGLYAADRWSLLPERTYTARDFGITTVTSAVDFNQNGTDDYTDILLGARQDARNHPDYDSRYWEDGYPPDDIGVCTDVVWRAFRNAGYCLRDMVDNDILLRQADYPGVSVPDSNIDFRRVINLRVFFEAYAVSLTLDPLDIARWQPGDIVIFGDDQHIGIVSDRRNRDGVTYIIHNSGQQDREEDILVGSDVTGHYRFDASLLPEEMLVSMEP